MEVRRRARKCVAWQPAGPVEGTDEQRRRRPRGVLHVSGPCVPTRPRKFRIPEAPAGTAPRRAWNPRSRARAGRGQPDSRGVVGRAALFRRAGGPLATRRDQQPGIWTSTQQFVLVGCERRGLSRLPNGGMIRGGAGLPLVATIRPTGFASRGKFSSRPDMTGRHHQGQGGG